MQTPLLLAFASTPAVLALVAFALLQGRWRVAHERQPTAVPRIAELSASEFDGRRWWLGMLAPLLLAAGTATLLQSRWQTLPQRLPIHWGLSGQPNHWTARGFTGVFGLLLFDAALVVGLGFLGELIAHSSSGHEGRSVLVKTIRTILMMASWCITVLFCLVSLLPLSHDPNHLVPFIAMGATVLNLGVVGYTLFRASRMERIVVVGQLSTDSRYWRAGLFYLNSGDSALMVPKRNGFGYTLNFGRPVCWLLLALTLILPLILPLLLLRSH